MECREDNNFRTANSLSQRSECRDLGGVAPIPVSVGLRMAVVAAVDRVCDWALLELFELFEAR